MIAAVKNNSKIYRVTKMENIFMPIFTFIKFFKSGTGLVSHFSGDESKGLRDPSLMTSRKKGRGRLELLRHYVLRCR